MNKKIIVLVIVMLIGLSTFLLIGNNHPVEIHTLGEHVKLLDEAMNSYERHSYCDENDLDYEKIVFYEAEFSVYNSGNFAENRSLPIFNPDAIKSILAVYSSIPINPNRTSMSDPYRLEFDSKWLEQQPIGDLVEPLKVKYVMQISDLGELPSQDLMSQIQSDALIQEFLAYSNLSTAKEMADRIRATMPAELQDNLKAVTTAYCLWIKKNISYPAQSDIEPLRGHYINLSNSKLTLENKLGVCEDNANLLKDFLNSQGIEAYYVSGIQPKNSTDQSLLPEEANGHAVVLVKASKGYYLIDPTTQDPRISIPMTLSNRKVIEVSSYEQNDNLKTFPLFMRDIKSFPLRLSGLKFIEKQIKYIRP